MLAVLLLPIALVAACDKVPLLAPTGSVITLFPATTTVPLNGQVTITATVIENGVSSGGTGTGSGSGTSTSSRSGNGTPVQNGTLVTFTTSIGRIEPSEARTHNGQVSVQLITDGTSGVATITAYSGGASAQITNLKVGTAAVKTVSVTTTPQSLGSSGGTATVSATVTDEGGNPIAGIPVTFATDKGSVSPSTIATGSNGVATATLNTTATAKITATAGTITSTAATVTVSAFGLSGFTASPSATTTGTPVTFTVTPTTGANVSSVRIDFGDGSQPQTLGSLQSAQSTPHAYCSPGSYTATASVTDAGGGAGSLSTGVVVGSLPVTLTASPSNPTVNSPVTLTVGGLGSALVDHYVFTFNDGTSKNTTGPQFNTTFPSKGTKVVRVDVFGIGGCQIASQSLTLDVQ
jgi:hypothetical protein